MDLNDRYTYKKSKKEIKRIIYIRGLGKKKDKEIVQKVVFVRTLKIDKENNEIVEQSGWTLGDESNGMFPEYIPETYEKKVTKVKKVPAKIITADDVDETVIVKYRSNKKQMTTNRLKEKIDRLTSNPATQSKLELSSITQSESQSEVELSSITQSESNSDVNSTSVLEAQPKSATQSESQLKSESTVNTQSESQSKFKSSSITQSESNSDVDSTSVLETQSKSATQSKSQLKSESTVNTQSESQSEFELSSTTQSESNSSVDLKSVLETQSKSATQSKSESTVNTQSESQSKFESSSTTQSESNSDANSTSILETQSKSAVQSESQSKSSSEKQSQSSSHTESESTYDTASSKDELSSSAKRAIFRRSLRENFTNLGNEKEKEASAEHSQSLSSTTNDYQSPQTTNFLKNNNETKTSSLSTSEVQSSSLNKLSTSKVQNSSLNEFFASEKTSGSLNELFTSEEASDTLDSTASSRLESDTSQVLNTSPTPTKKSTVNDWLVDNKAEKKMPTPTTDTEDNLDIITANEETYIKNVPSQPQQDEVVIISNSEKFKKYQKKIFEQEKSKKDFTPRQKVPINFSILTSFLAQNSEILNNSNVYQIGQAFLLAKKWKVELWTK